MISAGCEWIVEAHHCDASSVSDPEALRALFTRLIERNEPPSDRRNGVASVSRRRHHRARAASGIHIACHTFPEHRSLCLNVFCCRPRPDWDFEAHLRQEFGAKSVEVRRLDRPYSRMSSPTANCPSCGAPVTFRWSSAVQTVCPFCHSILVRDDLDDAERRQGGGPAARTRRPSSC